MRILGLDPGYAVVGWGILDYEKNSFHVVDFGAITTEAGTPFPERLKIIYEDISYILDAAKPNAVSVEKLFFQNNQKTAIDVAQARGVLLLAASQRCIDIFEYTPMQVKQGVVGYGRADKRQVQEMTKTLLRLESVPQPDDTADALAMAVCHAHAAGSALPLQGSVTQPGNEASESREACEKAAEEIAQRLAKGLSEGIKYGKKFFNERRGI